MLTIDNDNALRELNGAIARIEPLSNRSYFGQGIVICGGGLRYFTCAWVCINLLRRHLGCTLPIQVWHLGPELSPLMRELLQPLGVEFVDALQVRNLFPARILNGWELKPYAIIHSRFAEVLLLDADNVPLLDPRGLFDWAQYKHAGAVFWPDFHRLTRSRQIWRLTGVEYRDEPEFETGQILVDKIRCWQPLQLAMWMNEYSDFWYRHIHGDKETFHMAWRRLDCSYVMPSKPIHALLGTMCQHDFNGKRIFQHRNCSKWSLDHNPRIQGFQLEDICLGYIRELLPYNSALKGLPSSDPRYSTLVANRQMIYRRIGFDERPLVLGPNGVITIGNNRMERYWSIIDVEDRPVLEIYGDDGLTAQLTPTSPQCDSWSGRWLIHERMHVELVSVKEQAS